MFLCLSLLSCADSLPPFLFFNCPLRFFDILRLVGTSFCLKWHNIRHTRGSIRKASSPRMTSSEVLLCFHCVYLSLTGREEKHAISDHHVIFHAPCLCHYLKCEHGVTEGLGWHEAWQFAVYCLIHAAAALYVASSLAARKERHDKNLIVIASLILKMFTVSYICRARGRCQ